MFGEARDFLCFVYFKSFILCPFLLDTCFYIGFLIYKNIYIFLDLFVHFITSLACLILTFTFFSFFLYNELISVSSKV